MPTNRLLSARDILESVETLLYVAELDMPGLPSVSANVHRARLSAERALADLRQEIEEHYQRTDAHPKDAA